MCILTMLDGLNKRTIYMCVFVQDIYILHGKTYILLPRQTIASDAFRPYCHRRAVLPCPLHTEQPALPSSMSCACNKERTHHTIDIKGPRLGSDSYRNLTLRPVVTYASAYRKLRPASALTYASHRLKQTSSTGYGLRLRVTGIHIPYACASACMPFFLGFLATPPTGGKFRHL